MPLAWVLGSQAVAIAYLLGVAVWSITQAADRGLGFAGEVADVRIWFPLLLAGVLPLWPGPDLRDRPAPGSRLVLAASALLGLLAVATYATVRPAHMFPSVAGFPWLAMLSAAALLLFPLDRGGYLAVRPAEISRAAPDDMPAGVAAVWATLEAGDDGLERIRSLSLEPVSGPTVVRLLAQPDWPTDGDRPPMVRLAWPFDRFYLNERLAPDADALVAERFRAGKKTVAEVRLLDGQAVLTDVLIDGVSIRELVKQRAR